MDNKPWYVITAICLSVLLLIGVVCNFLYTVRDILPPFAIAFIVAWLLNPMLDRLQRLGVPRMLAVALVFTLFMGIFVVGIIFVIPAMVDQATQLSKEYSHYAEIGRGLVSDFFDQHHDVLARFNLPTTFQDAVNQYGDSLNHTIRSTIPSVSGWITENAFKVLWLVLIPLLSFYILNDMHRLKAKALLFVPKAWRPITSKMVSRTATVFSNYVRGLLEACLVYSIVTSIVLSFCHVRYGIVLGLLAGVLYAVPYLGAITILVLVFVVSAATGSGFNHAIWPTIAMLITNESFDLLITPRILGKSVGLHPALSIFAMMAGAKLFSLPGMILAVPIAASIQEIILEFCPELNPPHEEVVPYCHGLVGVIKRFRIGKKKKMECQ
jgi:predicted PurR-regulated permease PerM